MSKSNTITKSQFQEKFQGDPIKAVGLKVHIESPSGDSAYKGPGTYVVIYNKGTTVALVTPEIWEKKGRKGHKDQVGTDKGVSYSGNEYFCLDSRDKITLKSEGMSRQKLIALLLLSQGR